MSTQIAQMSSHSGVIKKVKITEEHAVLSIEEQEIKKQEEQLAIVKELRSSEVWHEAIPYSYMTPSAIRHSLTATTLRGTHKILRRPLKFLKDNPSECIVIVYLGDHFSLLNRAFMMFFWVMGMLGLYAIGCGNNGIHNGLLATLLDEQLAYVSLPNLPNFTGFTANLDINYFETVGPNQWIVIRGILDKVEGRKAFANAWIENLEGVRMTEARSLYISPKTQ